MDDEMEDLVRKYPTVCRKNYYVSFFVGPGWRVPLEAALAKLEAIGLARVANGEEPPLVAQVKEKFGGLRLYVDAGDKRDWEDVLSIVREAEEACDRLCEKCGGPAALVTSDGWMRTTCEEHAR